MNVIANIDTVMEMAYVKVEAYMTTPHSAADLAQLEATIVASIIPMLSGGAVAEVAADEAMLTAAAAEFANEAVPYLTDAVSGAAKLRSLAPKLLTQLTTEGVDTINVAAAAAKSSDVAVTVVADAVETGAIDAVDAGQVMRVVDSAKSIGFKSAEEIKQHAGVLERWSSNFKSLKTEEAAVVNAGFEQAPYLVGTKVIEFETTAAESFVRVHGPNNVARSWVMRESDIAGLSAPEIAAKFNIRDVPSQLSRVDIPAGVKVRTGIVGPNGFGNAKGAVQYEILMPDIPESWFQPIRSF